jgi:hypothetical protein
VDEAAIALAHRRLSKLARSKVFMMENVPVV